MTRQELLRAAAHIVDDDEIIDVGSQAVLGQFPRTSAVLFGSNEVALDINRIFRA